VSGRAEDRRKLAFSLGKGYTYPMTETCPHPPEDVDVVDPEPGLPGYAFCEACGTDVTHLNTNH
jgi:hypothetical protein